MKNFRKSLIMVLGAVVLLVPTTIHAVSGTVGNAATSMAVGATKDINIVLMAADDVQAVGGKIESNDATCVKINSMEAVHNKADVFGSKFALAANGAVPANTVMIKVNVTGLKECSTTFKYTTVKVTSTSAVNAPATISAGTITVGGSTPTPKSNDNTLSGITVSTGTLSPAFSASNTVYTVTVPNDVTSITVTGTKNNSKATVTGPVTKELSEGENTITITCTAEDGTPRTYTVKVTREGSGEVKPVEDDKSNDATLKSLDVSGYTLTPTFKSDVLTYTMNVGSNIDALNVTAIANHEKATVAVSGNTNFKPGMNTIYVTVTAENGTKKTYTVNVKKAGGDNNGTTTAKAKSSNNYLSNILVADGELSPAFSKETGSYSIKVPKDTTKLDLKAFAEDSNAKVEILDNDNLQIGSNTITIRVTAEDGSVRIYTLNVTKLDKEANTDIEKIIIGGGQLTPEFKPDNNYYETEVPGKQKTINVNAIPKNPNAKVEYYVNGKLQTDGNINLEEGYNLVTVKVTDENGFSKMYYINAHRKAYSYNIFGMKIPKWLAWLLGFLLLGFIFLIIFLLMKKDDDDEEEEEKVESKSEVVYPKIEFKPEFNFGSKNNDNDTVADGGVLNQDSSHASGKTEDKEEVTREVEPVKVSKVEEEVPYDIYDEVVTVDELIDAIDEQDPKKLRILYEQEMLNRKKAALKNSSEKGKHAKKDDDYEEE